MLRMKKAMIFGAGNIGRGFIGQLFSQSGYEVVFADIDESMIQAINKDRSYPISIVSNESSKEIVIGPVRAIDSRDDEAVMKELLGTDLVATAVGVRALDKVATTIARGLRMRWNKGNFTPINIIICENMLNADRYMKRIIIAELTLEEQSHFRETVGLVEASIGRMVPVVVQKDNSDPLRVFVEAYDELPVDKEGFKGDIPNINNMIPYSPFIYYIHRKLFMHNMGHAITAYLGYIEDYKYIWETIADPVIKGIVTNAFMEAAKAMSIEHNRPIEELMAHAEDLMNRFGNRVLGDTTERVARDPIRKLSAEDRLGGAAILCTRHGILPTNICIGIAAGFLYNPTGDEAATTIQDYIEDKGIEEAITHFTSFEKGDKNHGSVLNFYNKLNNGVALKDIERSGLK